MPEGNSALFRVTDLKQYLYCPRILYYHTCLPHVRPTTYKMQAGIDAHEHEKAKATRRLIETFDVQEGIRHFDVALSSERLRLTAQVDEVIQVQKPHPALIPIEYKLSRIPGEHFKVQLAAYAMLLEEQWVLPVRAAYLYLIPLKQRIDVPITERLRNSVISAIDSMCQIVDRETMPEPTEWRKKCASCEFRRFCNDVF